MNQGKGDSKMEINHKFLSNFNESCWVRELRESSVTFARG